MNKQAVWNTMTTIILIVIAAMIMFLLVKSFTDSANESGNVFVNILRGLFGQ